LVVVVIVVGQLFGTGAREYVTVVVSNSLHQHTVRLTAHKNDHGGTAAHQLIISLRAHAVQTGRKLYNCLTNTPSALEHEHVPWVPHGHGLCRWLR
jgi:glycine/serine hydroxymethyltransferase